MKYDRVIFGKGSDSGKSVIVDVYSVLDAFRTGSPAIDHAIKKLLAAGARGHKDKEQDLSEAIESILRAIEITKGKEK